MKKYLFISLFLLATIYAKAFDFSAITSSGHTLFYEIHGKKVTVVYPQYDESENTCYYGYEEPKGDLIIPDTVWYKGTAYNVDTIGYAALAKCSELTSVVLPNSLKVIASYAFAECYKLKSITIGKQLNAIEEMAFSDDLILAKANYLGTIESWCNINFGDGLLVDGELYFNDTLITELIIPQSVTEIKPHAFKYVSNLKYVVLPNTVKRIGEFAFFGCRNLISINIPEGVGRIRASTFTHCENLQKVNIPNTVTYIGQAAFSNCKRLESITLSKHLDTIESFAFYDCALLDEVNISPLVSYIGLKAFGKVDKIAYRGVASGSPWGAIERRIPIDYWHVVYHSKKEVQSAILNENDEFTGIYQDIYSNIEIGIVKEAGDYRIIYLGGRDNGWWKVGDLQGTLTASATIGLFRGKWVNNDFSVNDNCFVVFNGSSLDLMINNAKKTFLKMYPTSSTPIKGNYSSWTGTGFAISNGYIATNYHVVEEAKKIIIRGIKGDFNTDYSAQVVATDKVNDIAILKITDGKFNGFGTIPYAVSTRMADVGEDVFVLGYPLTQTMGEEIKLTNGIISSRTGFQGDVANYQMSAPIQPGNSGGPMFDNKGNVIGIICARHTEAENAGYAIKTSYLKNLIESADLRIHLTSNNAISTLSLAEKVKLIKKFVYFIECGK